VVGRGRQGSSARRNDLTNQAQDLAIKQAA
jgi:hypothetical protein